MNKIVNEVIDEKLENFESSLNYIISNYSEAEYKRYIKEVEDFLSEDYYNKNIIIEEVLLGSYILENITLGNYLSYLILISPFRKYKFEFDDDCFIDITNIYELNDYYNKIIQFFTIDKGIDVSKDIKEINDELTIFAEKTYLINSGTSISLYDIIELRNKNKTIKECMDFSISEDENIDPQKVEKAQNENQKKLIKAIEEEEDNSYKRYLQSGAGINKNQFGEVAAFIGYKPDASGKVIPVVINTSFMRGLRNAQEFLINAVGARKALITSKGQVKESGYLNRKLSLMLSDYKINKDIDDCGTKHTIPFFIDSKETLKRFNNRWMLDDEGDLVLISEDDEELIGKTINLRSPITCACKNNEVCPTCYGKLHVINENKNIGTIAELILTNPLTQKLLSTKHLLKVNMKSVNWSENLLKYFYINQNKLIPEEDKISLIFNKDDIIENETNINNKYYVKNFKVKKGNNIDEIESEIPLYFTKELYKYIDYFNYNQEEETYTVNLNHCTLTESAFYFIIDNIGVADPLLNIQELITRNAYIKEHTIEETFTRFINLLNKSGVELNSCHVEIILREMMFITENGNNKQIFAEKDEFPIYQIMNITDAIQRSESVSKSFVFEQVDKQLMTDSYNNVFSKSSQSNLDIFLENK